MARIRLSRICLVALCLFLASCSARHTTSRRSIEVSYARVQTLLEKYCVRCHSGDNAKGDLVLSDYASIMKGGQSGAVVIPGEASTSLLVEIVERGRMPLGKKSPRPSADELLELKAWIDAGAKRTSVVMSTAR